MIGVIGCGNMAGAVVRGAHRADPRRKFLTYTPSHTRAEQLANDVGGKAVKDLSELAPAESIIIACKPQQFADLAADLEGKFDLSQKHFISIMAALPLRTIQAKLGAKRVTRVMPNTPALFNKGVSLILHSDEVLSSEKETTESIFAACGSAHLMPDEESFDKVTTVSGSGPAYVFLFAKTMADQLESWGIDPRQAGDIARELFAGSARLMEEKKDLSLDELIAQVTSKGGVTIEAVNKYKERDLGGITAQALGAACARSRELIKDLAED